MPYGPACASSLCYAVVPAAFALSLLRSRLPARVHGFAQVAVAQGADVRSVPPLLDAAILFAPGRFARPDHGSTTRARQPRSVTSNTRARARAG